MKDGFHFNISHWQTYKHNLPPLPPELAEIALGMILGDGSAYKVSKHAYIKLEQGYKQAARSISFPLFASIALWMNQE
jgi:hypothetical protein